MRNRTLWMNLGMNLGMIVGLLIASLALSACGKQVNAIAATPNEAPYKLEKIDGSEFNLVTLTDPAAQRLELATSKVSEKQVAGKTRLVVPYSALIYGLHGESWIYVSPQPLSFHRALVTVDYIEGNDVFLLEGPAVGTEIATVAVAELYGVDTGVKK